MTRGARNGLILAALHLALVGSLGVKLLADRATCPRVWVRTAPVDPNLPIRGRYVRLGLEVERFASMDAVSADRAGPGGGPAGRSWNVPIPVRLSVRDGQLFAEGAKTRPAPWASSRRAAVAASSGSTRSRSSSPSPSSIPRFAEPAKSCGWR